MDAKRVISKMYFFFVSFIAKVEIFLLSFLAALKDAERGCRPNPARIYFTATQKVVTIIERPQKALGVVRLWQRLAVIAPATQRMGEKLLSG